MKPNGQAVIRRRTAQKRARAFALLDKGYSYRQIMKFLGYKSVWPVQRLLGKTKRKTA